MSAIIKQIELIKRMDQLIRIQATGTPVALAIKLGISKTKVYRLIHIMRALDAPIEYSYAAQSFVYEEEVKFRFGFVSKGFNQKKNHLN